MIAAHLGKFPGSCLHVCRKCFGHLAGKKKKMESYVPPLKRPQPDTDAPVKGGEGKIQERKRVTVKWWSDYTAWARSQFGG